MVQNAHFDPCELRQLPRLCTAIDELAADREFVCFPAAVQAVSQAQVRTRRELRKSLGAYLQSGARESVINYAVQLLQFEG